MLISFSITNFRSIKECQTFSMQADPSVKERQNAVFVLDQYKGLGVLKTSVFYGKNNAGKSNVLKAFKALQWLVKSSNNFATHEEIKANEFFLYDKQLREQPTVFEIDFIAENETRYVYHVTFDKRQIISEDLSFYRRDVSILKAVNLFRKKAYGSSDNKSYSFGGDYKGPQKEITALTGDNQLFLSKAATNNPNDHVVNVYRFITDTIRVFSFDSNFDEDIFSKHTSQLFANNPNYLEPIEALMKAMDTGILGIQMKKPDPAKFVFPENFPNELKAKIIEDFRFSIMASHCMFDGENEIDPEDFPLQLESTGTQKLFSLLAIIIDAFYNGHLLLIDELDKSLNPYWTKFLIDLFYQDRFNKNNTQLVFVSHDAVQLQDFLFAKDQINLIEKDYFGKTEILNLADFKGIRKDISLEKNYLSGRWGGVPIMREQFIDFEIEKKQKHEEEAKG